MGRTSRISSLERRQPTPAPDVETTQPNQKAVEYWATGLEPIDLEGALERARRREIPRPANVVQLGPIDLFVLGCFRRRGTTRLGTQQIYVEPNGMAYR